ncbi:glycosyltransferase family 4 protein [Haliangium ochraceum]|uniref:Glycosyl transferase group 1 n=1 Tax=Haliangium ochraceum (strain DSM 14365 / JCM 11303 / SMP-2) TaxID=502025 RepID=D0LXW3_HALO1|nr:glycosyltransferase family 4 protein [Haliangium ochraceum]ACY14318.1 glycosyl transferase group 1 [Haliangium ochraceum DSM 14365]
MRFVFAQVNAWYGLMSGGLIAQRRCAEGLAALGHECHAIVRLADPDQDRAPERGASSGTTYQTKAALTTRAVPMSEREGDIEFVLNGVRVRALGGSYEAFCAKLDAALATLQPDWIHVTDVDDGPPFLTICRRRARVVAHLHSISHLPFGPEAMFPRNPARAQELLAVDGLVCPSEFGRDYLRQHGKRDALALYYDSYTHRPAPQRSPNEHRRFVTLINPCSIKGLPLFLELAAAMPDLPFAAVPTWGRKPATIEALRALPNVTLLPPSDDIDDILRRTRVLIAPALWPETFGMVIVEAMLRGVPVVASDIAGHRESKLGVDYLLPVAAIEFEHRDGTVQKRIPRQNAGPWIATLRRLLDDPEHAERVARASAEAASEFVRGLSWRPLIDYLEGGCSPPREGRCSAHRLWG